MSADQIKNVAVIGMGTMGPGLSQAFALAGFQVTGFDANPDMLGQAKKIFQANLDSLVEFGDLEQAAAISPGGGHSVLAIRRLPGRGGGQGRPGGGNGQRESAT